MTGRNLESALNVYHASARESSYRKTSNISRTSVGNEIVDNSDVVAEHRLSALLQLHLRSRLNTWLQWIGRRQLQGDTRNIYILGFGATYTRGFTVVPEMAMIIG